jgi:hypothetical protein
MQNSSGEASIEIEYFDRSAPVTNPIGLLPSHRHAPSTLLSIKSKMQSSSVMSRVIMFTKKALVGFAPALGGVLLADIGIPPTTSR